jgi:hypothetical protein
MTWGLGFGFNFFCYGQEIDNNGVIFGDGSKAAYQLYTGKKRSQSSVIFSLASWM